MIYLSIMNVVVDVMISVFSFIRDVVIVMKLLSVMFVVVVKVMDLFWDRVYDKIKRIVGSGIIKRVMEVVVKVS